MSNKTAAIIADLTVLATAIKAQAKAHKKVDVQWQLLALSAIAAFDKHGNVFYINEVYKNLGKGARHVAMTAYFTSFGGVSANEGENKDQTPFIKDGEKKVDMAQAAATNWFDMKPSAKPDQEVDYLALALKLVKRSPKEGQASVHSELRLRLSETIQQYADAVGETVEGLPTDGTDTEAADELAGAASS